MGVPFALPTNLRECADRLGVAKLGDLATVGQVLKALGNERAITWELRDCYAELIRLIDVHNASMTSGKLAAP